MFTSHYLRYVWKYILCPGYGKEQIVYATVDLLQIILQTRLNCTTAGSEDNKICIACNLLSVLHALLVVVADKTHWEDKLGVCIIVYKSKVSLSTLEFSK